MGGYAGAQAPGFQDETMRLERGNQQISNALEEAVQGDLPDAYLIARQRKRVDELGGGYASPEALSAGLHSRPAGGNLGDVVGGYDGDIDPGIGADVDLRQLGNRIDPGIYINPAGRDLGSFGPEAVLRLQGNNWW
jgi:hypothetical protein